MATVSWVHRVLQGVGWVVEAVRLVLVCGPCLCREETDKQLISIRNQAAAREERISAQAASKSAQLQSEADSKGAAAAEAQEALAAARADIRRLTEQVGDIVSFTLFSRVYMHQ